MKRRMLLASAGLWIVIMLTISAAPVEAKIWPYVYYRANGKLDEYNPSLPGDFDQIVAGSWRFIIHDGIYDFKACYLEENGPGPEIEGTFDKIKLTLTEPKSLSINSITGVCEIIGTLVAYKTGWDPATGKPAFWSPLFSIQDTKIVITESKIWIYLPIPGFTEWAVRGSTLSSQFLWLLHVFK